MSIRRINGSRRECWNCEQMTDQVIQVVIRAASGKRTRLTLCVTCYESVYLPLVQQLTDEGKDEPLEESVLIVDDDPDTLSFLKHYLQEAGFAVRTAMNGAEALERACRHVPAAIVLDMSMPVMSGREFLKAWRQIEPSRSIPIVAMSGFNRDRFADDLGVLAFLPKPFEPDALVNLVAAALDPQLRG